jgi:lipopolysaccharide transport system ATP-binding protein
VIVLARSTVAHDGAAPGAVAMYLSELEAASANELECRDERRGRGEVRFTGLDVCTDGSVAPGTLITGRGARFVFRVNKPKAGLSCVFTIYDRLGHPITYFDSNLTGPHDCMGCAEGKAFSCELDEMPLLPGRYRINAALSCYGELEDHVEGAGFFDVEPGAAYGRPVPTENGYCSVVVKHRWIKPCEH